MAGIGVDNRGEFVVLLRHVAMTLARCATALLLDPKAEAPAGSVDGQADLAFWNSIKDRNRPEELQAYLAQFPEGRFAALARLRLKDAEAAQASGATASGAPDANVMREIQDRLYKLNFPIVRFDGSVDETTDRAIKAWQIKQEFAPSGTLNAEQLKVLRATVPASTWGAIAHPVVGTASMVFSKSSRQEAESQALADCKAKNGVACKVIAAAASECAGVALYRSKGPDGRGYVTHFYSREVGTAAAKQKALLYCNAHLLRAGNRCLMVGAVCGASATTADELNKGSPPDPANKLPPAKGKGEET
jgi:peptidoglycan hydrolase-like protein with peptidoglycan-binding domain